MTYRKLDIPKRAEDPAIDPVIRALPKRRTPRARVLNLVDALLDVPATTRRGIRFKVMVMAELGANYDEERARALLASITADQDRLIPEPEADDGKSLDTRLLSIVRQLTPKDTARALKAVKVMARVWGRASAGKATA